MYKLILYPVMVLAMLSCSKNTPTPTPEPGPNDPYFPPASGAWKTLSPDSLGWSSTAINDLYTYLDSKNTKAFLIIRDGRIVTEKYFGTFRQDSLWYWASAGKTMTAMLVGIAQQEGKLSLADKTSKHLGVGWTTLPREKEDLITIRHHLSMTTGLKPTAGDDDCTLPGCLSYKADAGTAWSYHNASYTLLESILTKATGKPFETYFNEKIRNRIGMNGSWQKITDYVNVYYSDARSMARYGILMLNNGKWGSNSIISDGGFFSQQVNSSQDLNLSYGYLTWLNGKASHRLPVVADVQPGAIAPNAPSDMYFAWGRNDQKIYVVPSKKLVIVRMGEGASNVPLGDATFDNELWGKLRNVFGY
jgi:CubicO group peptidase (beta-lactamase class C family)